MLHAKLTYSLNYNILKLTVKDQKGEVIHSMHRVDNESERQGILITRGFNQNDLLLSHNLHHERQDDETKTWVGLKAEVNSRETFKSIILFFAMLLVVVILRTIELFIPASSFIHQALGFTSVLIFFVWLYILIFGFGNKHYRRNVRRILNERVVQPSGDVVLFKDMIDLKRSKTDHFFFDISDIITLDVSTLSQIEKDAWNDYLKHHEIQNDQDLDHYIQENANVIHQTMQYETFKQARQKHDYIQKQRENMDASYQNNTYTQQLKNIRKEIEKEQQQTPRYRRLSEIQSRIDDIRKEKR